MRKRRLLVIFGVVGLAVVGTFIALLLRSSGDAAAPQVHGGSLTLVAEAKRKQLPDLTGPTLIPPPAKLSLDASAGRPAFIDVWASWCIPCREEAPVLARLWRDYRDRMRFLGIDIEDTRHDARAFVRRFGLGYPSIFDDKAAMATKLGFFGLPTAYLVDARGRIAAKLIGKQTEAKLRLALQALVRDSSSRNAWPAAPSM